MPKWDYELQVVRRARCGLGGIKKTYIPHCMKNIGICIMNQ